MEYPGKRTTRILLCGHTVPCTGEDEDCLPSDYYVGYTNGVFEVHSNGWCHKEKLPMWRYRLFSPFMRLFTWLAGAHPAGERARLLYEKFRSDALVRKREAQLAARNRWLSDAYDRMTQEKKP